MYFNKTDRQKKTRQQLGKKDIKGEKWKKSLFFLWKKYKFQKE